jgi:hypothetical protein
VRGCRMSSGSRCPCRRRRWDEADGRSRTVARTVRNKTEAEGTTREVVAEAPEAFGLTPASRCDPFL